ncbi:MAG: DUF3362 domain-containing protein, partial [Planctomycetes bacterium]|nr:DUF3362 domain-containing protein [Planctomycetota bacterium]
SADPRSRTFRAYVEVDNAKQVQPLLPGYFVTAVVEGPRITDALLVPRIAILDGGKPLRTYAWNDRQLRTLQPLFLMTMKPVFVAKHLRDRKLQRALMQFFKPENYFQVRKALLQAGRRDLIGGGCDCLIPANPPREAIEARREQADREVKSGDYVHSRQRMPRSGYRPGRRTATRRERGQDER